MPNPHSAWRIDLAHRLARKLVPFNGVRAIVVAGSVARDVADEYSDVEIPIFWDQLPGDGIRHSMAKALQAGFLFAYDGPANEDQLLLDRVQVDLWHIAVERQEELIQGVLQAARTDLGSLNAMETIRSCIPLHGDELVRKWKASAREYPPELTKSIVQEHLPSFRLDQLSLCADRNDLPGFFAELVHLQREVFVALLAINRRYFPTFKWMNHSLESLPNKPASITSRFHGSSSSPLPTIVSEMQAVLVETVEIIQEGIPDLDVRLTLRRLEHRRLAVHAPPR